MMIYRKTSILILFLAFLMIWGCAALQEFAQKPTVKFDSVSFENVSLFEATPVFKLKVTNPNPLGLAVSSMNYDLKINNKPFIKDILKKGLTIPAGGSNIIEVPVTLNYLDLFETVTAFNKADTIDYDLSGSVGLGILDIPYHKNGNFPVPKIPEISLKNVGISNLSLTGASVVFSMELENSNPFTVQLNGLDYGIKLGGKEFAKGNAKSITPIEKNGKSLVEIPLDVSFLSMGRAVYNILTKSSSEYELSGAMKLNVPNSGEKSFPFQKIGEVPFHK